MTLTAHRATAICVATQFIQSYIIGNRDGLADNDMELNLPDFMARYDRWASRAMVEIPGAATEERIAMVREIVRAMIRGLLEAGE